MLGETQNQFSLTRVALSTCGRQKSKSIGLSVISDNGFAGIRSRPQKAPMTKSDPFDKANATWVACVRQLPLYIARRLAPLHEDPSPLTKYNGRLRIMRLRVVASPMQPENFWSPIWCFYEIGIGVYEDNPRGFGAVKFLQFSDNQLCGHGHYHDEVCQILKRAENQRPRVFKGGSTSGGGGRMPHLTANYAKNSDEEFPIAKAAGHLAWLIEETFPRFNLLSP